MFNQRWQENEFILKYKEKAKTLTEENTLFSYTLGAHERLTDSHFPLFFTSALILCDLFSRPPTSPKA